MPEQDRSLGKLVARTLGAAGIVLAVVGAYYVSVAFATSGILLGTVGYAVGARNFGRAAVVLGVVSIFVGLLVGQRAMPGSYDQKAPQHENFVRNVPDMPAKKHQ
ncbi:hypothetical protein BH18ACT11_BH18ACT11_00240 [soil metagenome]